MASRLEMLVEEIHELLDDETVAMRFGRKHIDHHDQARRIVWARVPSTFDTPRQAGQRKVTGSPEHRVQTCIDRYDACEAHIWAEDDETADDLLDSLIAAIYRVEPFPKLGGYNWVSEQPHEAGETLRTDKIVLRVAFRFPVPDEIKELKPVESFQFTTSFIESEDIIVPPIDDDDGAITEPDITAAHDISALRVITFAGEYAQPDDVASLVSVAGITTVSYVEGESVLVRNSGLLTDSGWSWTPGRGLYVGVDGTLTHTPSTVVSLVIGLAISATQISLNIQEPLES